VIYLAVVSFVLLVVSGFFYNILLGWSKFNSRSEISYNVNFIEKNLGFYIREAQAIQNLSPETLVLLLPMAQTITFHFDTTQQKLTRQQNSDPAVDLNTDKVAVRGSFSNLSHYPRSRNILVNLEITLKNPGQGPRWQDKVTTELSFELRSR
jgi:hypothetical protein